MMVISMAQNVYMLSMAFLVPLRRLKAKYVCLQTKEDKDDDRVTALDTPFVLYPNAICRCWVIEGSADIFPITSNVFYFNSNYNGVNSVIREIEVTPLLMELNLGKKFRSQYFLVLKTGIDKVFGKEQTICSSLDFCTEFDIVNLKKAFFERGKNELCMNQYGFGTHFYDWLQIILLELEGKKGKNVQLSYTVIDACVQKMDVNATPNMIAAINKDYTESYYHNGVKNPMDNYLRQKVCLLQPNGVVMESPVPERHFVYGALYANDNFMMADRKCVDKTVATAYSNNHVEKYWADDETIVHIKTNSPFYYSKDKREQKLKGKLDEELPILLDMSMLAYIKLRLQRFKQMHRYLSAQEIEDSLGVFADFLYGKLFNQTELDKRMDYFVEQFRLHRMFNEIREVVIPRKNSMEIAFLHNMNIWVLLVGVLTLLVTIIGLFVTLLND